ncbi:alpha-ketoglutarate-dependent dioxygenase AlkB family protein [Niabella hibiscisoli]|uniref:alpha-ketoglutarate-dependent dioxygenase AlkB family protein n=1 Tax=Niabella hibiscisoli TaxID=1825928 RepID=UPI001F1185C9|nr:alpha-ketoglutarate-dependent dioxygenase AlkB [Niabella hibiscisoli]MCH5720164.1 alpha-ketoglutarate-dependent dioxygenase AlkB [Niabella hibiscisoli]
MWRFRNTLHYSVSTMQQKLFDDTDQFELPLDLLSYIPAFISPEEGNDLLRLLLQTVPWQQHKEIMYDKEVVTPRLSAWYGDTRNADGKIQPQKWLPELYNLKGRIERFSGESFQGVLLNYYRDGNDSVAWHADRDTLPGVKTAIASLSIGQERLFDFRHKQDHTKKHAILLQHGSLLLMQPDLQKDWEHRIAKSGIPMRARINMTFRKVME